MPNKKKSADPLTDTHCPQPKGTLIAIGGHEEKERTQQDDGKSQTDEMANDAILRRFVDELRKKDLVVVIPTASSEPEEAAKDYVNVFTDLGVKRVEVLNIKTRNEAESMECIGLIKEADGFMFTGGDQLRLTALLGGTAMLMCLKQRYANERIVIAGTSAGATAMSTPMVYQGRDDAGIRKGEIHITTGLQFMHDVAIDTHFVARGRIVRMAQIISTNPGCLGLGLEEDTGVVVTQGCELEVIGSGIVVIVDGTHSTYTNIHEIAPETPFTIRDLRVHLLSCGERYTLPIQEQLYL
ncbi:cyanophycinase [Hymenobacter sp. BT491]|uniref:cyanophycinase n=1 Tax=Hymenobacter sp. BT491 TaxID=2766779 RepID=UPI0016538CE1|nr:cyanophycinase [Hymenobacter sp. BT491]MBC6990805.1 cyanophycinase [Hymenobacter sp. BT491]